MVLARRLFEQLLGGYEVDDVLAKAARGRGRGEGHEINVDGHDVIGLTAR